MIYLLSTVLFPVNKKQAPTPAEGSMRSGHIANSASKKSSGNNSAASPNDDDEEYHTDDDNKSCIEEIKMDNIMDDTLQT